MDRTLSSRRGLLAGGLALAATPAASASRPFSFRGPVAPPRPQPPPFPPLKQLAPFPVGVALTVEQLADPITRNLIDANFAQLTPGLEMKMEVVLKEDGGFNFTKADQVAAFARGHALRLHAHTLVWYIYKPAAFTRIANDRTGFATAYRNYILAVAGRYRGQATGWDVVNEPTAEDGEGYRDCLWRQVLGMDYIERALRHAREADPTAILFLNEYNLESLPRKRTSFMRLIESLLKRGAPLGGIGTQMHMGYDQDPRTVATMMRDLAGFGLPIHVSELDVSTRPGRFIMGGLDQRLKSQARLVGATVEAFMALPQRQRYAFTTWGLRDTDSWLRAPERKGDPDDRPLLFDAAGKPKPAAIAFAEALRR